MVIQRSQLDKLNTGVIPAHHDHTHMLVGIYTSDDGYIPEQVLSVRENPNSHREPNHILAEVIAGDLKSINDDPKVKHIVFTRLVGNIEFTDDQIFAAYKRGLIEFDIMAEKDPWLSESREEFKKRDPIGYDEAMGGYERILYAALGYI